MADYRWNLLDNARGYDAAAEFLHPYYRAIQDVLLAHLLLEQCPTGIVIDLGGGSGRLAERILERYPQATVWVVDQSEAFLTLSGERLARFGDRAHCLQAQLQSEWSERFPDSPRAIVSTSAIHHLDASEKQQLYQQCANCLAPGGVLMNGDEVRPESDEEYLSYCRRWVAHMHEQMDAGRVPESLHEALLGWETRNVQQFGMPRSSGDDCHETAAAQLSYFRSAGLEQTELIWHEELWGVLFGRKPV